MEGPEVAAYDALVIGGGPGGASAAIRLAQAGWSVAVVERKAFPRRKVCGEFIAATTWPLLRELGLPPALLAQAGPEVTRVGLFAADTVLEAPMPSAGGGEGWGRALGREALDTALLARAAALGACVWQPFRLTRLAREGAWHACTVEQRRAVRVLRARVIVAAHGSWDPGALPTQPARAPARPSDLLGFKAHFRGAGLAAGLMPLLLFPGGYGGMVHTDGGRVSLSLCIRRDALARCRERWPQARAGEAVLAHLRASCRGVHEVLASATRAGAWLSAGPIRPGRRPRPRDGVFAVGNAAGEAHPIVAEGIGMAIQSACLLADHLGEARGELGAPGLEQAGRAYAESWGRNFAGRVRAAALFAQIAQRPFTARLMTALLAAAPAVLTLGAVWSGKAQALRRAHSGAS